MGIKLNLGASPIWRKEGWHVLDHKLNKTEEFKIAGDATAMDLQDESCDIVFCSHVVEHIPHAYSLLHEDHVVGELEKKSISKPKYSS